MFDGLDHVWKAVEILAVHDAPLKDRLKEAAGEFFVSMLQPGEWPKNLVARSRILDSKLQKIDRMDPHAARQAAQELLSLAADVYTEQIMENENSST